MSNRMGMKGSRATQTHGVRACVAHVTARAALQVCGGVLYRMLQSGIYPVGDGKVIQKNDGVRFVTEKNHIVLQLERVGQDRVKQQMGGRYRSQGYLDARQKEVEQKESVFTQYLYCITQGPRTGIVCNARHLPCFCLEGHLLPRGDRCCAHVPQALELWQELWRRPVFLQLCLELAVKGGDAQRSDSRVTWAKPRLHSCCVHEPHSLFLVVQSCTSCIMPGTSCHTLLPSLFFFPSPNCISGTSPVTFK